MPEDFPIDTDGLLGWDMLTRHEAKVNAANKRLEVGRIVIPFERDEQFVIPPHTRQVINARVQNNGDRIGFVPLQDLGKGLPFGNFVAENKDGKAYALNNGFEANELDRLNILRVQTKTVIGLLEYVGN